jgi:hypothetical protein
MGARREENPPDPPHVTPFVVDGGDLVTIAVFLWNDFICMIVGAARAKIQAGDQVRAPRYSPAKRRQRHQPSESI